MTEIETLWRDLAGGHGGAFAIERKGRRVVIPRFLNGVAQASFDDFCGQPFGPGDYLAIAQTAKVLFLTDIPTMGPENANEAKRFVTLIDALYEAKTKFIATAAAPPEMLYPKGKGAFEFDRTVSRLNEMQSAEWSKQ